MSEDDVLDQISDVRAHNNDLWMKLVRIALNSAPAEAKEVLRQINGNDRRISTLLKELTT